MKTVKTYWARIYVAYKPEWSYVLDTLTDPRRDAVAECQEFVDKVGLCVTVTDTEFIYKGGSEPGIIVGLINYPRFPATPAKIRSRAIALATRLKKLLKQKRVSIEFPNNTVMLGGME